MLAAPPVQHPCATHSLCRLGENLLDRSKAEPMCPGIRENTMASFNAACELDADFVEFDVQVCSLPAQCTLGLALAYVHNCTAYVHARKLGYVGEEWRDIVVQGDIALYSMYVMHVAEECDACNGLGGVGVWRCLPCVVLCVCKAVSIACMEDSQHTVPRQSCKYTPRHRPTHDSG
jgi:hypothetical protein